MKNRLKELFDENKDNFTGLLNNFEKLSVNTQWGMGIIPPYSVLPLYTEIGGFASGKFAKNQLKPGKNRQCYFLDADKNIIRGIEYADFNALNNKWIVYNSFYRHADDSVIEYRFGSAFENDTNASLQRVIIAQFENGKVVHGFSYGKRGEYEELEYKYQQNELIFIKLKVKLDVYFERDYKILHNNGKLRIEEIMQDGESELIYEQ